MSIALLVMMVLPWVAFADDISNNLDSSVDAVAEVMPLNAGGANGTTQLYVTPRNSDGKNGCNLTSSTTLGVSVSSSNPSVATVSPSSVTFTNCSDTKTLTVTPVAQGSATISVSQTSNTTDGTFNLAPATFTVNVAPPANTAPQISVADVTGGANYNKGSVPAATCQVTDAEDGNSSFAASLSAITGPYASDGIGSQTASCSYTDGGGLTASASETYNIVDPSAPVIGSTLNPATPDGLNGWYKSNVSLTWDVTETESPNSLQKTGCLDQTITADQAATTYSCSAMSAGGSAGPESVTIKRDATAPSITQTSAPGSGWYNTNQTVTFAATDATSGVNGATTIVETTSGEGAAVTVNSGAVSDFAGNTNQGLDSTTFQIDLSDPTNVTFVSGPDANSQHYFGYVPAAPTCTADDAISGLASCVVTGYSTAVGSYTLTATATDNAGRTTTATRSYSVLSWTTKGFYQPVDMGANVFNTVKGGSTVPLKFEVFAGTTELTSVAQIKSLTYKWIVAPVGCTTDDIELTATGGTSLRYDTTSGQFVYNFQTPKQPGKSLTVTITMQDGSTISANFMLK
jgi:hypothetical protein